MERNLLLLLPVALLFSLGLAEAQDVESSARAIRDGQDAIYRLDFEGAEELFGGLTLSHPGDPAGYGMLVILELNRVLFEAKNLAIDDYATPNPFTKQPTYKPIEAARQRFLQKIAKLQEVCDRRLEADPNDSKALYFKGLAFENLATEALAVRRNTGLAQKFGKQARILHERVLTLDPSLVDANISIAVWEFTAATLPWSIKWFAFLLGYRGDKEKALQRLDLVSREGLYRRLDARVLLALLQAWKGDPARAVAIFDQLRRSYPENFLTDVNLASIHEHNLEDPRQAIEVYRQLLSDRDRKAGGLHVGEVHLRIGRARLRLGDSKGARESFLRVLESPCGEIETQPLAHFHLARLLEESGMEREAQDHYRQVLRYPGPAKVLEAELKQARRKVG